MPVWFLLESNADDAAANMAVDETLLLTAAQRGFPLLRVYAWSCPSASFGYFQKFPAHLAPTRQLVRRPTGGGLVYHGADTTYTIVAPPDHPLAQLQTAAAYQAIHQAVAAALQECAAHPAGHARCLAGDQVQGAGLTGHAPNSIRGKVQRPEVLSGLEEFPAPQLKPSETQVSGFSSQPSPPSALATRRYECFENPVAGDVMADGRKLAGGAQRRSKRGLLHQGSIAAVLTADQLARGFRQVFDAEFQPYRLTPEELALAARLACEKYSTDQWNQRI